MPVAAASPSGGRRTVGSTARRTAAASLLQRPTAAGVATTTSFRCATASSRAVSSSSSSSAGPPGGLLGASSSAEASQPVWKKVAIAVVKGILLWLPAAFFWGSVAWGSPLLDARTEEQLVEEEIELKRLERFFGVDALPDAEYMAEWTVKEEALSQIVDKMLKSQRFIDALELGRSCADAGGGDFVGPELTANVKRAKKKAGAEDNVASVEVSYVLPPVQAGLQEETGTADDVGREECSGSSGGDGCANGGLRPSSRWEPRLVVCHRSGAVALIRLGFHFVAKDKDREERWACTLLHCDLVASRGGGAAPGNESICNLEGPLPHGVRYMRI